MDDQESSGQNEQQQEQKRQDAGPANVGQSFNAAKNIGRNLFRLGKFSLTKKKSSPESAAADKATEEAAKVVKKGISFILKRSAFAFGATFFWVVLIFVFFLALFFILFPSGGIIPDSAKALIPTAAPIPTGITGGTGSSPGGGGGGPGSAPGTGGPVSTIPPISGAVTCPISGGIPSCGSQSVPVNTSASGGLCGHCGAGYENYMQYCTYPGIYHALDVVAPGGSPVYLPTIKGGVIKWTYLEPQQGATQAIQRYAGVDEQTGEQYYIQFHHTENGSGNPGDHQSGDVGAITCGACGEGHVHIEFGSGDPSGVTWLEAPQYFCS